MQRRTEDCCNAITIIRKSSILDVAAVLDPPLRWYSYWIYNNAYYKTIKMKPFNVKYSTYIDFDIENNNKSPKFKGVVHVKISKIKNNFGKGCAPKWSEDVFAIKIVKGTEPWTYVIKDLNGEEFIGMLHESEIQKTSQTICQIERLW